jgi:hypothetical protein
MKPSGPDLVELDAELSVKQVFAPQRLGQLLEVWACHVGVYARRAFILLEHSKVAAVTAAISQVGTLDIECGESGQCDIHGAVCMAQGLNARSRVLADVFEERCDAVLLSRLGSDLS